MFSSRFATAFLVGLLFCLALHADEKKRCAICGMFIKDGVAHSFDSVRDGKPVHFCSYGCAHAFHRKYPDALLTSHAYDSGKELPAANAYFIVKSEKLADEFKHAMPPVIVAFSSEEAAKKAKDRVKEGEIVKGFDAIEAKR